MNELIVGSLGQVANRAGMSIAQAFMDVSCLCLVDTSGSMEIKLSDGRSRYEVACAELRKLQGSMPGKIAVVAFSDTVKIAVDGVPDLLAARTDMAYALEFAKRADVGDMQFVLISDGYPDSKERTLAVARTFKNKISTIFIGEESDHSALKFLHELADLTGGKYAFYENAMQLSDGIKLLLKA